MIGQLQLVFCPPLLGKPDPEEPRPAEGPDVRHRVLQKGAKDNTCWYSAFNMLRERYKAPNTDDLPERTFERIASLRRKELARLEHSLPALASLLNVEVVKGFLSSVTPETIRRVEIRAKLHGLDERTREGKIVPILPDFLRQTEYKTLYEYLVHLKLSGRLEIDRRFFKRIHVDPKDLFEAAKHDDADAYQRTYEVRKREDPCSMVQGVFLDHLVRMHTARTYGLQISSWHPKHPLESLMKELQEKGPLCVGGIFGPPHYADPAKKLNRCVDGRAIYGWAKGAARNPGFVSGHTIIIVGAEKTGGQEVVYYIDPTDDSDPLHVEAQKVYVMSYKRLISSDSIQDFHGFLRNDAPPTVGYALYRNKSP